MEVERRGAGWSTTGGEIEEEEVEEEEDEEEEEVMVAWPEEGNAESDASTAVSKGGERPCLCGA